MDSERPNTSGETPEPTPNPASEGASESASDATPEQGAEETSEDRTRREVSPWTSTRSAESTPGLDAAPGASGGFSSDAQTVRDPRIHSSMAGRTSESPGMGSTGGSGGATIESTTGLPQGLRERYRLVRVLGKGGFANVYLAHDKVLDQDVAIKILKLDLAGESDQDRFLFEARIGAKLRHPNIAMVYDIVQAPDGLQMIMEYCPEGTLSELIKKRGHPLKPRRAIAIARQVAGALSHAHRRDVIHRDIKPANIFMCEEGQVKLGDFGIAAQTDLHEYTQTGMIIGTPLYMAPEQAMDSRDVDPRADIYSLGLTLYYMLTARAPRVLDLELVPEPFRGVIKRSTAAERGDRMVSADQFKAMLDRIEREHYAGGAASADWGPGSATMESEEADRAEEPSAAMEFVPSPDTAASPAVAASAMTHASPASEPEPAGRSMAMLGVGIVLGCLLFAGTGYFVYLANQPGTDESHVAGQDGSQSGGGGRDGDGVSAELGDGQTLATDDEVTTADMSNQLAEATSAEPVGAATPNPSVQPAAFPRTRRQTDARKPGAPRPGDLRQARLNGQRNMNESREERSAPLQVTLSSAEAVQAIKELPDTDPRYALKEALNLLALHRSPPDDMPMAERMLLEPQLEGMERELMRAIRRDEQVRSDPMARLLLALIANRLGHERRATGEFQRAFDANEVARIRLDLRDHRALAKALELEPKEVQAIERALAAPRLPPDSSENLEGEDMSPDASSTPTGSGP